MSKKTVLKASALALAIAAAPSAALAEVSGSLGISSQYLWRGQQLFGGGVVHGSVDYAHESGLYAGSWVSSEAGRTEYDLYAGFGGETDGGFSYDISYIDYNYTTGGTQTSTGADPASTADFEEIHIGVGMAGVAFDAYIGVGDWGHSDSDSISPDGLQTDNNDMYYSLSYGYESFGFLVGMYDYAGDPNTPETDEVNGVDYTHLDISYAVNDQLTFTASKIVDQEDVKALASPSEAWDDDVVLNVSYSFAF